MKGKKRNKGISYLVDNLHRIVPSVGTWISVTKNGAKSIE
jgi:hypothetical protein